MLTTGLFITTIVHSSNFLKNNFPNTTKPLKLKHLGLINRMSSFDRQKLEYDSESELVEDYKKIIIANPNNLNLATEYLFESLVEEAIMGVAFQMHFESKYPDVFGSIPHEESSKKHSSSSHGDYGAGSNKFLNCKCLNCEKTVSANKFASHLENCMGLGRNSSRIASRKKTTNSSYYTDYPDAEVDDDDGDANWSTKEKTKKKPQGSNGRNGKNKNKNYM